MRALVDIISTVTNSIRFIFLLFFLCIMGFGLMMTAGASYVAPQAVDKLADKAIEAAEISARESEVRARNYQMSREGWGYSDTPGGGDGFGQTNSGRKDEFVKESDVFVD